MMARMDGMSCVTYVSNSPNYFSVSDDNATLEMDRLKVVFPDRLGSPWDQKKNTQHKMSISM